MLPLSAFTTVVKQTKLQIHINQSVFYDIMFRQSSVTPKSKHQLPVKILII